jgi:hypothetical protein
MITQERIEAVLPRPRPEPEVRVVHAVRPEPTPTPAEPGLLWRLILVAVGFGVAMLGFTLILTALLAFIGLPLFIFGLALMQAQER